MTLKRSLVCLLGAVSLAGVSLADATVTTEGTVLTIDVPAGESYTYAQAVPSSLTKIVKTGTGSCEMAPASISFTGTVEIQAGTLHGDRAKFGSPADWKIAEGAALRFDTAASDYKGGEYLKPSGKLTIGGFGCDDMPAYYFTMLPNNSPYSTSHQNFGGGVTLSSDTSVGGGRFGFATMDMQGYDLYTYCTNGQSQYEMYFPIKNAGNIHVKKGQLLVERAMTFTPAVTDQFYELADGTTISMYNHPDTPTTYQASMPDIRLEPNAVATLQCTGPSGAMEATRNTWRGDWHLGTGRRLLLNVTAFNRCGTMKGSIDGAAEIYKTGSGIYTITPDATHVFGKLTTVQGTLTLGANKDGSTYQVTNYWDVGGTAVETGVARLNLGANSRTYSNLGISSAGIRVARSDGASTTDTGARRFGVVAIGDGAVVSNNFLIGSDGKNNTVTAGAVYMDDATVYWKAGGSNDGFIGQNSYGYGYFCQNAGSLTHGGYMNLGATGRGCIDQRGGVHRIDSGNPLKIARTGGNSWGCYHQTGGTFDGQLAWIGYNNNTECTAAVAILTTTGAGSVFKCNNMKVFMSRKPIDTIVNVNDGATLQGRLYRDIAFSGYSSSNWSTLAPQMTNTTHLYVNLNGGVLKSLDSAEIWGNDRARGLSRATVYEKGVTFDTTGKDITLFTELVKPFGKGLKSVTLPKNAVTNFNYYVGSPRIRITSSTGTGASAFAVFNEKTRQVERIDVTGAGCGYEDVTIQIENNAHGLEGISSYELADLPTTGGVRKVGTGTLTLNCANTYGGATRVEGGTIAFTHEAGYPGGDLELAASVVTNAVAPCVVAKTLAFNAEAKIRVTHADELDPNCCHGLQTLVTTETALTALPPVAFVDADGDEVAVSPAWTLRLAHGGKAIEFGYQRGTMMIFR